LKEDPPKAEEGAAAFLGIPAALNPDIPPFTTTNASMLTPLFVAKEMANYTGPIRGEKKWQQWAQDMEDFGIQ